MTWGKVKLNILHNLLQTTLYKNGDITFVYIKTHNNISAYFDEHLYDGKLEIGISDGLVRLSVGIESIEDLMLDIENSLN